MKIVFSSPNIAELALVQAILDENSIEYFLSDEQMSNILPHYAVALGGIKVMVRDEDFITARQVIEERLSENEKNIEKHISITDKNDSDILEKCPICGSANIEETKKPRKILSLIMSLLFMFPFPIRKKYYQCTDCQAYWNNKELSPIKFFILIIFGCILTVLIIKMFG